MLIVESKVTDFILPYSRVGYIQLSSDYPNVSRERTRKIENNFAACLCSNCEPMPVTSVIENYQRFQTSNFDDFMKTGEDLPNNPLNVPYLRKSSHPTFRLGSTKKPLDDVLEELVNLLLAGFGCLYNENFDLETAEIKPEKMFEIQQARSFSLAVKKGLPLSDIKQVIGGDMIDGQMQYLQENIVKLYCGGDSYWGYLEGKRGQKRKETELAGKSPTKADVEKERRRLKWLSDSTILEQYKADNNKRIREENEKENILRPNQSTSSLLS
jgi:hypothetical protein